MRLIRVRPYIRPMYVRTLILALPHADKIEQLMQRREGRRCARILAGVDIVLTKKTVRESNISQKIALESNNSLRTIQQISVRYLTKH